MTSAQRQRNYRRRRKASGVVALKIEVNAEARQFLAECFDQCGETLETWSETLRQWLLRGACFSANAGATTPKRGVPEGALRRNSHATTLTNSNRGA